MKIFLISLLVLIFVSSGTLSLWSEERGLVSVEKELDMQIRIGTQYLLLIAINQYAEWQPLEQPVKDAVEIRDILVNRYYIDEVIELYDSAATKAAILGTFEDLKAKCRPDDSLLIFYAGHGYSDSESTSGYWIPVDAGKDMVAKASWLPNYELLDNLSAIKAAHICLLADSCFSGKLLDTTRAYTDIPDPSDIPYFRKAYNLVSRQVMTSGSAEPVSDTSEFAMQLKMALAKNTVTFLDPVSLYDRMRLGIYGTLPLFGNLKSAGHQEGASFLLFLKDRLGSILVHTDEAGTLFLNNTLIKEISEGDVLLQNLDPGDYTLSLKYGSGNTREISISLKPKETAQVRFPYEIPPESRFPSWVGQLSAGCGFPLSGVPLAAPSFGGGITSELTLVTTGNTGLGISLSGAVALDSVISADTHINRLLSANGSLGIFAGIKLPLKEGFFLSGTIAGGYGYSRFLHETLTDNIFSWDPCASASLEFRKRLGKTIVVSFKASYTMIFYINDLYHQFLFGTGFGIVF